MAALIALQTPYKTNGALTSKWVALHSGGGVRFKFQRTDFIVTSTSNSAGNTSINCSGGGIPALTVGGQIYVILNSGVSGLYTVVSNTATAIVCTLPWTSNTTGYVNLTTHYSGYYVGVDFMYSTDNGSTWIEINTSVYFYPSPDQTLWINVTPYVKHLLVMTSQGIFSGTNDAMTSGDAHVRVSNISGYYDNSGSLGSLYANQELRIANAANQLQNANAENLLEYMTNNVPTQTMKFLSDFDQPTQFIGYPFHLSFIYSELMTGLTWDRRVTQPSGTSVAAIDTSKINHVNRLAMPSSYAAGVESITVQLKNHSTTDIYSETKTVKVNACTIKNPVVLKWIGLKGAWNFWVFGVRQDEEDGITTRQGELAPTINNLATADTDSDFITKEVSPTLKLYADNLTANDIAGLKTLFRSVKVMQLDTVSFVAGTTENWKTVRIGAGRYGYGSTFNYLRSLEFTIEQSEIYVQTQ